MYDVLVIGAGPAGGSTAIHCAEKGLKTLIVEEHGKIGEPVHCGECLSDFALDDLKWKLPDEAIALRVKGVRVIFPGMVETKLTEPGVVLEKHKFEQWICEKAVEKGAELRLSTKVESLEWKENGQSEASSKGKAGFWIVKTNVGEMQAKIVVDASGVSAITTRLLGFNKRFESVIGIQYEMQEIPTDGYLDFYLWPDLAPHGYLWMIPKNSGRANVGLVTNQNNKAKPFLDEFVRRLNWQGKKVVKTFGGLIPSSGPVENTVGDGLILVGDAAGFTSPLFEGGTHLSMKSGQYAAQVAQNALEREDTSKEGLTEYERLWKAEFPDYSALIKGKNALYDFTYEELNEVGRLMPQELSDISITQKASIGLDLLLKKRHLMKKGVMDAFKAFAYSKAEHYGW